MFFPLTLSKCVKLVFLPTLRNLNLSFCSSACNSFSRGEFSCIPFSSDVPDLDRLNDVTPL
ncbi:hypothetical protein HanRHA438_Chr10g0454881 [Helianthus annuus]|nr:hypothetical protein HanRHA438_Chr10g0454881 [Helianthus annuus]